MSLTDDWKAGKLKKKSIYWADLGNEKIEPAEVDKYGYLFGLDGCFYSPERCEYVKILAACDYDHFVELNEKVKELEKDIETITNNYKLLEKKQAVDIAHGQALVDEFGDYEALYQELIRLKREVAKGDRIIGELFNEGNSVKEENKQLRQLLERGTQLLSFEHEEYEVMSFVSEVNEVLK